MTDIDLTVIHDQLSAAGVPLFDSITVEPKRLWTRIQALINGHFQRRKEQDDAMLTELSAFQRKVTEVVLAACPPSGQDMTDIVGALHKILASEKGALLANLTQAEYDLRDFKEKADKYDQLRRLLDIPND